MVLIGGDDGLAVGDLLAYEVWVDLLALGDAVYRGGDRSVTGALEFRLRDLLGRTTK